jgi:hypothetical protein
MFYLDKRLYKNLRNYLHEQGYYCRVGTRKPLISEVNRKKRLSWAKERKELASVE